MCASDALLTWLLLSVLGRWWPTPALLSKESFLSGLLYHLLQIEIFYRSHSLHQRTQFWAAVNHFLLCSVLTLLDYQATLTDVDNVGGGFADMNSTFRFTANTMLNGTVVECRVTILTGNQVSSSTLNIAGAKWYYSYVHCMVVQSVRVTNN